MPPAAIFLIAQMFFTGLMICAAQDRQVALTIDDLPLNGPQFPAARLERMTGKFLSGIKKHRLPAVGFVNESLLYRPNETDARIAILKSWIDAGIEPGNHTFSHISFRTAALAEYKDDFIRGETVTKMLLKDRPVRYFRHPFLHMSASLETEKAFEDFISERGYKIAPVTIDTMDWMFLSAYLKARNEGDKAMMKRVSEEYVKYVDQRFEFSEKISNDMFGRPVRHIILLHANELSADNFEAMIKIIRGRGYRFITLEEALRDEIYRFPDKYAGTSDWLSHWAFAKGVKQAPPRPPEFIQRAFDNQ